ncbi:YqgE/AlgH family protein [Raineyella sp. LH-20]|uniref:YqgE/AlgH family protein n=1 Tax=Raineyella sp. LH-20 TaxID=3081204 RepID=UPI0029558328|nr:YqgE/AlgH family protein [Raineyella sp. LH-20]WOP17861.1 YqgE/AlgH family protein [Raineyella sp. LH-20]
MEVRRPRRGDLLVSTVDVRDGGVFEQSVIFLVDADDDGALGVVLNKRADLALERVLPDWAEVVSVPRVLYQGGPVLPEGAVCLASVKDPEEEPPGWRPVVGRIGLLHLDTPVELVVDTYDDIRIFVGYAGWSPWQLETEIGRGLWYVVPAAYTDVFGHAPWTLWREVLHRQGGDLALYATWTETPHLN